MFYGKCSVILPGSRKETLPPLSPLIQVGVAMGQRGTEVAKALGSVTLWWMRLFSSLEPWTSWMFMLESAGQWFGLWVMNYNPKILH